MRTTYPCRDGRETICGKAQNLQECGVVGRLPSALLTRVCTLCIHRKVMTDTCVLSHVWLFVTLWTVPCQAPLSMGFFWQEYWSGLPFPSPGDLPNPGAEPRSPALQADSLPSEPPGTPHWHSKKLKIENLANLFFLVFFIRSPQ